MSEIEDDYMQGVGLGYKGWGSKNEAASAYVYEMTNIFCFGSIQ